MAGFGQVEGVNQGFPWCSSRGSHLHPLFPFSQSTLPHDGRQWNPLSGSGLKEEFVPTLPHGTARARGWSFRGSSLLGLTSFPLPGTSPKTSLITQRWLLLSPSPLPVTLSPSPGLSLSRHRGALLVSSPLRLREWAERSLQSLPLPHLQQGANTIFSFKCLFTNWFISFFSPST